MLCGKQIVALSDTVYLSAISAARQGSSFMEKEQLEANFKTMFISIILITATEKSDLMRPVLKFNAQRSCLADSDTCLQSDQAGHKRSVSQIRK